MDLIMRGAKKGSTQKLRNMSQLRMEKIQPDRIRYATATTCTRNKVPD